MQEGLGKVKKAQTFTEREDLWELAEQPQIELERS